MRNPRSLFAQAAGVFCAPERIRTSDTGFRRAVLYPLSYWGNTTNSTAGQK